MVITEKVVIGLPWVMLLSILRKERKIWRTQISLVYFVYCFSFVYSTPARCLNEQIYVASFLYDKVIVD